MQFLVLILGMVLLPKVCALKCYECIPSGSCNARTRDCPSNTQCGSARTISNMDWSISSPNGKKCFQCDGNDCTKTLTCNGNEDYCISAAVPLGGQTTKLKGCASKMICSGIQTAQISGFIGEEISCCRGDLCNSASSTTAHHLLFVAPLISLILFS
ncbi:unnamed protein product [Oreochromis niloticus]|nr:unnamed protein product [Mustela putorius furo]